MEDVPIKIMGRATLTQRGIQLSLERLSEKVHATIPKGTVGDFEVTVLQRKSR